MDITVRCDYCGKTFCEGDEIFESRKYDTWYCSCKCLCYGETDVQRMFSKEVATVEKITKMADIIRNYGGEER